MKLVRHIGLILILIVLCNLVIKAQNFSVSRGMPFVRNYSPEEYKAHEKNFAITQGQGGLMYFANFAGTLQFDGTHWNKIASLSGMRILSVNKDKNGRIYAGGVYDFGYLETKQRHEFLKFFHLNFFHTQFYV